VNPSMPNPLVPNPFAVLGLPEWPDLDDETVDAAWRAIAAETHPDRPDGGNLARYTQATAAYFELHSPWGRSEAFADLLEAAWAQGRYDAYPGHYPPGYDPDDDLALPPTGPWEAELGPVPLAEILHQLAQIPARFRRGHPAGLLFTAVFIAGVCVAVLTMFPGLPDAAVVAAGIGWFVLAAWEDMAPPDRPVRRLPPPGRT
jgi:hypothetical protein